MRRDCRKRLSRHANVINRTCDTAPQPPLPPPPPKRERLRELSDRRENAEGRARGNSTKMKEPHRSVGHRTDSVRTGRSAETDAPSHVASSRLRSFRKTSRVLFIRHCATGLRVHHPSPRLYILNICFYTCTSTWNASFLKSFIFSLFRIFLN